MSVICTIIIYRLKSFANRLQISLIRAKNSASAGIYNMYISCTYNIVKAVYSAYRRIFRRDCLRRSVGMAAHMSNRFAILGDVIVTGGTDSRNLQKALRGVPLSWVDLSACFRVGISSFCVLYAYRLYRPLRIPPTVLAGSPSCSAYLLYVCLCYRLLRRYGAAFQVFGAAFCTAAFFFRTAILYNNFRQFVLSGAAAFFADSKGYTDVRFSAVAAPFGC